MEPTRCSAVFTDLGDDFRDATCPRTHLKIQGFSVGLLNMRTDELDPEPKWAARPVARDTSPTKPEHYLIRYITPVLGQCGPSLCSVHRPASLVAFGRPRRIPRRLSSSPLLFGDRRNSNRSVLIGSRLTRPKEDRIDSILG